MFMLYSKMGTLNGMGPSVGLVASSTVSVSPTASPKARNETGGENKAVNIRIMLTDPKYGFYNNTMVFKYHRS